MVERSIDYLDIRTPDEEAYANCWIAEDTAGADAQCYIYGPKRGDEIFSLVQNALQIAANTNRLPIKHIYASSNKGALALIQRTEGYRPLEADKNGNKLYEKVYIPQQMQTEE